MATMTYSPRDGYAHAAATRPLRLTRRGRVVVVLVSLAIAFVALALSHLGAPGATAGATPTSAVVHSGDTLWSFATRVAPDRDPRVVVEQIRALNHLGTASLHPGQTLLLPG